MPFMFLQGPEDCRTQSFQLVPSSLHTDGSGVLVGTAVGTGVGPGVGPPGAVVGAAVGAGVGAGLDPSEGTIRMSAQFQNFSPVPTSV